MIIVRLRRVLSIALCAFALILATGRSVQADRKPGLWGALRPGPYAVGFASEFHYDYSRVWKVRADEFGSVLSTAPRPVRVSYWFPAAQPGRLRTFRDYVVYGESRDANITAVNAFLAARDTHNYLHGDFADNPALLGRLFRTPVFATSGAIPASGRFPLILYGAGWNSFSPDNTVLCEYLASYGYVVATVPQLPRDSEHPELFANAADIQQQMRDLQTAQGVMETKPFVDSRLQGEIGYSLGSVAALWIGMTSPGISAIAALDPSFGYARFTDLATATDFTPRALHAPLLMLRSTLGSEAWTSAVISQLKYGDVYTGSVTAAGHGEFSDYPAIRT